MSVQFSPSTDIDLDRISAWQFLDDSKVKGLSPEYWLTGAPNCILACRVSDSEGVVLYVRCEQESGLVRFHTLFAPPDVVTHKRVALTLLEGFPKFAEGVKHYGTGLVMETRNESLAKFMLDKFGFVRVEGTDDYKLEFAQTAKESGDAIKV